MHSFEVHSHQSACRKGGHIRMDQVNNGEDFVPGSYVSKIPGVYCYNCEKPGRMYFNCNEPDHRSNRNVNLF